MKVIINRRALLDALALAAAVANGKHKPVLGCVLITLTTDVAEFHATDLERTIVVTSGQVQVDITGSVCVDVRELNRIVSSLDGETLALSLSEQGNTLTVMSAADRLTLFAMSPGDFPPRPDPAGGETFTMPFSEFAEAVAATSGAAAESGTRYAFNGVLVRDDRIFVATDGRRLHRWGTAGTPKSQAIVPPEALKLAARLQSDGDIGITLGKNAATFAADAATLTTNLFEGTFPPFEEVCPRMRDATTQFVVGSDDLTATIHRGSLTSKHVETAKEVIESRACRLELAANELTVSTSSPRHGDSRSTMSLKIDGNPLAIGFNPDFVMQAIRACDSDDVRVGLYAPNRPLLVEGGRVAAVVMPVNLQ